MYHKLLFRLFFTGNGVFALDVLVFQNNEMAAKPTLWEFNFSISNVNTFFCSNKFAWLLDM